jgi:hypothetical protein
MYSQERYKQVFEEKIHLLKNFGKKRGSATGEEKRRRLDERKRVNLK